MIMSELDHVMTVISLQSLSLYTASFVANNPINFLQIIRKLLLGNVITSAVSDKT